jgi:hypothetical protein
MLLYPYLILFSQFCSAFFDYNEMYQFEQTTPFEFAGSSTTFSPNTLKISVTILNWPFLSLSNSLSLSIDSKSEGNNQEENCAKSQSTTESLQWIMVIVNDVALYPT